MRIDSPPASLTPTSQDVPPAPKQGAAMMEVRREPGLMFSYVARDDQGRELWRYPRESIIKISSLSEKPRGLLINIKA